MALIKFVGYVGVLLFAESVAVGLTGSLVLFLAAQGLRLITTAERQTNPPGMHWVVLVVKCMGLWFLASLIVIGAAHYARENGWYFWLSVIIGAALFTLFKTETMQRWEREMRQQHGETILVNGPFRRLLLQDYLANSMAIFYVFAAAIFDPLQNARLAVAVAQGILWPLTNRTWLSIVLYTAGWLLTIRYAFVVLVTLPAAFAVLAANRRRGK